MLFDLRGRGRRRAVQAIYLALAVLMGGGLVLFGVGGATGGGLLDAFKNSSGTTSTSDVFKKRADAAERAVRLRPRDAAAWENLAKLRFQQAAGNGFDDNAQAFTQEGLAELGQSDAAWTRALTLTSNPDPNIARTMVQVYSSTGLNQPGKAVSAYEIVVPTVKPPTAQVFANYATLAYEAGQTRKATLASAKALTLSNATNRADIKSQLDQAKAAAATSTTATPAATPPATTATTATTTTTG